MHGSATAAAASRRSFTIKSVLVPLLTRPLVAKAIKYTVYSALVVNFFIYLHDDYNAFRAALPPDAPLSEIFEQFSTTIDMAAWLGLVFLFELETYALSDEAFEGWLPTFLRIGRFVCYVSIAYAAYGYTAETLDFYDIRKLDATNACQLADQQTSMQTDVINYEVITSANCEALSHDSAFYQVNGEIAVLGETTLHHVRFLGWIDVDNAVVWLIVVFLIEIEVWLQATDRFSSRALTVVRQVKTFFYLVLIGNAIIWVYTGYYVYAWDAFLWIFGFWAIELNLAEWERDRLQELQTVPAASASTGPPP